MTSIMKKNMNKHMNMKTILKKTFDTNIQPKLKKELCQIGAWRGG